MTVIQDLHIQPKTQRTHSDVLMENLINKEHFTESVFRIPGVALSLSFLI